MTGYRIALFIHVLAAIVWVGGGIMAQMLIHRTQKAGDPKMMGALGQEIGHIAERVFTPASVIVLLAGIYMVLEADIGFSTPWVAIGLIGLIATVIMGVFYLGPQSKKMGALMAEHGPTSPEVGAQANRLIMAARIDVMVLVFVVFAMTYKPF